MSPPQKPPLPDWDPRGPKGPPPPKRTFDQKVADDLRDLERANQRDRDTLKQWDAQRVAREKAEEAQRKAQEKAEEAKLRIHGVEWADRRTKCVASFGLLKSEITKRKNNWVNHAIAVSHQYEEAYRAFGSLLENESTHSQLMWTLAFTALGSVASGGIAVLSAKISASQWNKSKARELFITAANDTVQGAVGGLLGMAVPVLADKFEVAEIPSPFKIQGEWTMLLNTLENEMLGWSNEYQERIKDMPLSGFEHFNPRKLDNEIRRFLAEKDEKFQAESFGFEQTKAELKNELEKMMVGLWTAAFLEKELARDRKVLFGLAEKVPRRLPDKLVDRLVHFGFVDDSRHFSEADVLKVARWGPNTERTMRTTIQKIKAYKPKKFG